MFQTDPKCPGEDPDQTKTDATKDEALFSHLRDAGMDIQPKTTVETYVKVDSVVWCTIKLTDDAIKEMVHSSLKKLITPKIPRAVHLHTSLSLGDATKAMEMLRDYAL